MHLSERVTPSARPSAERAGAATQRKIGAPTHLRQRVALSLLATGGGL